MRVGFVTGSPRTGTTFLCRVLGDHPNIIAYREMMLSRLVNVREINRHYNNALCAGFSHDEIRHLGSNVTLFDYESIEKWLRAAAPITAKKLNKENIEVVIEKDPEFCVDARIMPWATQFPLVHTVRHPFGILDQRKDDIQSREDGIAWRKRSLAEAIQSYENIKSYLHHDNILVIRYEDLVSECDDIVRKVFSHFGIHYSNAYKQSGNRDDNQYSMHQPKSLEMPDPERAWSWAASPEIAAMEEVAGYIGMKRITEYAERFDYTI